MSNSFIIWNTDAMRIAYGHAIKKLVFLVLYLLTYTNIEFWFRLYGPLIRYAYLFCGDRPVVYKCNNNTPLTIFHQIQNTESSLGFLVNSNMRTPQFKRWQYLTTTKSMPLLLECFSASVSLAVWLTRRLEHGINIYAFVPISGFLIYI